MTKNLLALLAAALLIFAGVGWYLGWYNFTSTPSGNGKQRITVDVDTKKIGEDLKKAKDNIEKLKTRATNDIQETQPQEPRSFGEFVNEAVTPSTGASEPSENDPFSQPPVKAVPFPFPEN